MVKQESYRPISEETWRTRIVAEQAAEGASSTGVKLQVYVAEEDSRVCSVEGVDYSLCLPINALLDVFYCNTRA
jgi:hypothetical protein